MAEPQRPARERRKPDRESGPAPKPAAPDVAQKLPAPAWAGAHVPAPFGLGGVQRKVTIGPVGDAYEREADRVAADVASGRAIAPSAISPIGSIGGSGLGQRASASGTKPEQDKKPEQDRKPEQGKKPEREKPVAAGKKPEGEKKKTDDLASVLPVQKAAAPAPSADKKSDAAAPGAKKDTKKDTKKDEQPKPGPVQKADVPATSKEKEKEAGKSKDKQKEPPKPAPVQRAGAAPAAEKKEAEKPKPKAEKKPGPVQKAGATAAAESPQTPKEKDKKQEKDKSTEQKLASAPVRRAAADAPADKKEKKAPPPAEKKKDEKPAARAVQKADTGPAKPTAEGVPVGDVEKERDRQRQSEQQKVIARGRERTSDKPKDSAAERKARDEAAGAMTQRAGGGAATPAMESAASSAVSTKGPGEPMQGSTRQALESRMGVGLGGVRVHEDNAAREASRAIQAKAFTHGSDIWLGPGESQSNVPLMAHEATHVVQQAGGVHRMVVQREKKEKETADEGGDWDFEDKKLGKVKKGSKFLIPKLKVPDVKKPFTKGPVTLPKKTEDPRPDNQRTVWEQAAREGGGIDAKLAKKKKDEKAPALAGDLTYLKLKGRDTYVIGNDTAIRNRVLRPYWDKGGNIRFYDVDHQLELQLGGSNDIANMWLLESKANQASGREIRAQRDEKILALLKAGEAAGTWKGEAPTLETIRSSYTVTFEDVVGGLPIEGDPSDRWTIDEIRDQAKQLDSLKVLSKKDIDKEELRGSPQTVAVYTNPTGGGLKKSEGWKDGDKQKAVKWDYGKLFQVNLVKYNRDTKKGSISGVGFRNSPLIDTINVNFDIEQFDAVEYGGYVSASAVTRAIQSELKLKGLSPIVIQQAELTEKGLVGRGEVLPTLPLLKDLRIDLILDGENIYLSKVFSAGDFKFPGPIKVTGASLEIFAGTQGVGARGDVLFEIERVGKGQITGKGSTRSGFELEGKFDFDSEFFKPATVKVWYRDEKFGGEGEIGIPEGRVKGIKSARLKASFEGESISATGSVKPAIPGVEQGDLSFSYDPKTGVVIAGKLELKKDIPGLEGGSVTAELAKRPGDDKWKVKAAGEATPKVPGVSARLAVTYDDGAFDAFVVAGYEKGMLKGSIMVGATNRPVGEDGKPAGPPPDKGETITIYGGGSLTLKLAPWLQATAGVKLLPNGEIQVTGEIGLPAALEIFKEKKFDKNIFKIGIDIPIVGVSVAGQRIGIFANIGGGLDLSAGIGPAELNQLRLAVTYNPAHEENTQVVGDANLHIPAHAGLRLFVRGSLGVGIPIVSASAGLEIGGQLGLEGALDAGVHVDWAPTKGLDLTAQASIYVEPKLKFDITGFVLVEADLLLTTIELYSQRWQLASFEYGSGLRFGLKFPIHYQEGHPFDISLSDVEFEVPKIEPESLLENLIKQIA
jgi:hypothetical protein